MATRSKSSYLFWKRLFDILFSTTFIILLIPFFIILSIIVAIDTKSFPIFRQNRVGKNKKIFKIYKFRSMKKSAPKDVSKEDFGKVFDYVTRFGRFIRRTSIDELPQLFNILFGSMSFVGPRPIIWNNSAWIEERDKYNAHSIRPGITGLAQINGRDSISYEEKSKLDGIYCKKISFTLDLKIIFKTIRVVITKNGVIEDKQG